MPKRGCKMNIHNKATPIGLMMWGRKIEVLKKVRPLVRGLLSVTAKNRARAKRSTPPPIMMIRLLENAMWTHWSRRASLKLLRPTKVEFSKPKPLQR